MYELLQLENFKEFSCIGDRCPDNCCHSWRVYINKSTYKKYKKNKNIKSDNLVVLDKNNSNIYAEIKLNEDGYCPFLDKSGLCDIHKNYGKNMLSNVCAIYPQNLTKFNNRLERSIKLSCPAAVDCLFSSSKPLEFSLELKKNNNTIITTNEDLKINEHFDNKDYFALRGLAIAILQYRDINIKERLYILGKISYIIDNLIESKEYTSSEIRAYIEELELTFKTDDMLKTREEYNLKNDEKSQLLAKLMPIIKDFFEESSSKNKTDVYKIIQNGLINIENIKVEEIRNCKENVLDKFFLENQYVLEHYLVCKLFEEVFPKNSGSVINAFNLMLNKLLMLYVYLIVLYKDYDKINLDDFKNVLYFFERQLSHSKLKKIVINNLNTHMGADWDVILDIIF